MARSSLLPSLKVLTTVLFVAVVCFACAYNKAVIFHPDRSTPVTTIATLAWAMQHNDIDLIGACFSPQCRFLQRLGGKEGLSSISAKFPPDAVTKLYWQSLLVSSISDGLSSEAIVKAVSIYQGEIINITMKKEESGWVITGADAYPMPVEARYPTIVQQPEPK